MPGGTPATPLPDAVLVDLHLVGPQVPDRAALAVADDQVERDEIDGAAERRHTLDTGRGFGG